MRPNIILRQAGRPMSYARPGGPCRGRFRLSPQRAGAQHKLGFPIKRWTSKHRFDWLGHRLRGDVRAVLEAEARPGSTLPWSASQHNWMMTNQTTSERRMTIAL
jgi:hypothetical protein